MLRTVFARRAQRSRAAPSAREPRPASARREPCPRIANRACVLRIASASRELRLRAANCVRELCSVFVRCTMYPRVVNRELCDAL